MQTAVVKTGFDLGLFTFLAEAGDSSVSLETIVEKTGADIKLLSMGYFVMFCDTFFLEANCRSTARLLSYLSSVNVIKQVSSTRYAANQVTRNLAEKVSEAGISHW